MGPSDPTRPGIIQLVLGFRNTSTQTVFVAPGVGAGSIKNLPFQSFSLFMFNPVTKSFAPREFGFVVGGTYVVWA